MKDERESTAANASRDAVLADRLPKVLASRLRAARRAVGLSQGAVASAMHDRGFSWRQTTVAKSEAADRPVLFSEVAALAQIYRKDIEYFLYAGTELDALADEAQRELLSIEQALKEVAGHLASLKKDRRLYECMISVASSVQRYRNTSDGGVLLGDLRMVLSRWGHQCLTMEDVFESIDVTPEQLKTVDKAGLDHAAQVEWGSRGIMAAHKADGTEMPELLRGVRDFLEGKEVSETLLEVLREGGVWVDTVTPLLTDLVIDAVNRHLEAEGK